MTSRVFYAPSGDAAMDAAHERARATFKYFWREVSWERRRIIPALSIAAVKAAFEEGGHPDETEHMWLGDVLFDGERIRATLLNQPNHLRSLHKGDLVTVRLAEIEDWMYGMNGRAYGGFSVQAMRKRMRAPDRKRHDDAWGYDFGDFETVEVVPNWNAKKPGVLGKLFGSAPPAAPSDPDAEHPMSENMAGKLAEAIDRQPDAFLRQVDDDGMTTLHSLALAGSAAGVRVLLEKGADTRAKTKAGKTALDLAEALGWPRVVALLRVAGA